MLFFDQFGIPGFEPFTYTTDYFRNLKENRYLPYSSAGVVNPIELHFIFMAFTWFFLLPVKKNFRFQSIPAWGSFILFLATFVFSFVNGIRTGDFLVALWEVRALFYLCFLFLFVPQIIQTKKQIQILLWISIIAITLKALQAIHRYMILGFSTAGFQTLTNHEDPVFTSTIFILALGFFVFGIKGKQKWLLLMLCIPLAFGFYIGLRRAAYAGLIISVAAFFVLLPMLEQRLLIKRSMPFLLLLFVYVGVFWNYPNSGFAGPVNLIKSGIVEPDKETNLQDYYSNLYRDFEDYNLAVTIQRSPLLGIGFGNKYDMPLNLANISFPLRDYIPHNEIFWYLIKTGAVGFLMFWIFFNAFAFKSAYTLHRLKDPYAKAVCAMITIAVINQMVVSYFDLQLTYYRNMIYLGTLMGLLPTLITIADKEQETKQSKIENNDEPRG
ncbi:MAG: O-antigen ligase family protein [Gracilimonas sp.]|nr:O-antigen ligase family protein [Gracilimonas sp.]